MAAGAATEGAPPVPDEVDLLPPAPAPPDCDELTAPDDPVDGPSDLDAQPTNAQTAKENLLLGAGYTYFNTHFADVGLKYKFDESHLMLGANALIGVSNDKILVISEISAIHYFNNTPALPQDQRVAQFLT